MVVFPKFGIFVEGGDRGDIEGLGFRVEGFGFHSQCLFWRGPIMRIIVVWGLD